MTSLIAVPAQTGWRSSTRFAVLAVAAALMLVTFAVAEIVDPRQIGADGNWVKPMKFALSFALFFATQAVLARRLSPEWEDGRVMRFVVSAVAISFLAEMAYLAFASSRAEASHFNVTTPFHLIAYQLMGVGAVTLVAGVAAQGWVTARDTAARMGPRLRQGVVWGFWLTFLLTLVVAGYMSNQSGHHVGHPTPDAPRLPVFGWSAQVGDLRPAHFLSIHAMQILPAIGWLLDRRAHRSAQTIRVIGLGFALLTAAVFGQALMGRPLIAL